MTRQMWVCLCGWVGVDMYTDSSTVCYAIVNILQEAKPKGTETKEKLKSVLNTSCVLDTVLIS